MISIYLLPPPSFPSPPQILQCLANDDPKPQVRCFGKSSAMWIGVKGSTKGLGKKCYYVNVNDLRGEFPSLIEILTSIQSYNINKFLIFWYKCVVVNRNKTRVFVLAIYSSFELNNWCFSFKIQLIFPSVILLNLNLKQEDICS